MAFVTEKPPRITRLVTHRHYRLVFATAPDATAAGHSTPRSEALPYSEPAVSGAQSLD